MGSNGLSVVIPSGGRARLALLDAALASMRRCAGIDQIIVSELGPEAAALDVARRWGADHLFTHAPGPFDKVRATNTGSLLARRPEILWCDGDLLFGPDFVPRALEEFRAGGVDFLFPYSGIAYIDAAQSQQVMAGVLSPAACRPVRTLGPLHGGAPGGMGLVRSDFLRRHGGMIAGFQGWGCEDDAWVHKVSLLGRIAATRRPDQQAWHLFHPDSGSHSQVGRRIAMRNNPSFEQNHQLFAHIHAISSAAELQRQFPPPPHAAPPWPAGSRIAFLATAEPGDERPAERARDWARRLELAFGVSSPVLQARPSDIADTLDGLDADLVVGIADSPAACAALAQGLGAVRFVLAPGDLEPDPGWRLTASGHAHWVMARTPQQADAWAALGTRAWWQGWSDEAGADHAAAPAIVQPLSHLLNAPHAWKIRIVLDRAALPPAALDQPPFWYVGFHDANDAEIVREDAGRQELRLSLARGDGSIVIDREVRSARRPARWTVWPTDRSGRWLDKLSGPVDALCAP
jgi:hypothetical protein